MSLSDKLGEQAINATPLEHASERTIAPAQKKHVDSVTKPNPLDGWKVGIGGFVLLLNIVDFLFALAGVAFLDHPWAFILVKTIDDVAKGQVIAAIVGLVGGYVALITYYLSYQQKQYHQNLQLANARDIAEESVSKQNDWERKKLDQLNVRLKQEKDHFAQQRKQEQAQADYDSIAAEYDALSKDFVAKEELARINAAIGLAAIAKRADPRREFKQNEGIQIQNIKAYYPWFERIAMQLASALIIYDESRARDQVRNSIRDIAKLDDEPGDQPLLTFLINTLADANRTAYKTFLETFAEGMACENEEHLETFARAVTIFAEPAKNRIMLANLSQQKDYVLAHSAKRDKRKLNPGLKTPGDPDPDILSRLRISSQQLADTRAAISDCVRKDVRRVGEEIATPDEEIWQVEFEKEGLPPVYQRNSVLGDPIPIIRLGKCFLQGADIGEANLQSADLCEAQLQSSDLSNAQLTKAFLYGAQLQEATLSYANLNGADLSAAILQAAVLYGAKLEGANLAVAQFQGANLSYAQLKGAIYSYAKFDGTMLYGAIFAPPTKEHFPKALMWRSADFRELDVFIGHNDWVYEPRKNRDKNLINFLRSNFPDGGPKVGEVWPDGLLHEEDYAPEPANAVPPEPPEAE